MSRPNYGKRLRAAASWSAAAALGIAAGVGGRSTPASAADCSVTGPSLQTQIDAAPAGSVLKVVQCLYRETAIINKPLVLDGQSGAEIRGSDVWSGWNQSGGTWVSQSSVPPLDSGITLSWQCTSPQCYWPEQVIRDGVLLTEVAPGSTPSSGQFSLNGARQVVLADNPNGHSMEVSTRARWLVTAADNVTIQGFVMRDAGNGAVVGAVGNNDHNNWTLQDSHVFTAHGPNVMVSGASNPNTQTRVLRNDIGASGMVGIAGYRNTNTLIQGNHIWSNNTAGFSLDWSGGGVKLNSLRGVIVDGNDVHDNMGPGLWCDEGCSNATYSNNRVYYNNGHRPSGDGSPQIFFEISDGVSISNNAVWGGVGWPGIYVSSSANAEVRGNVVAWTGRGIQAYEQNRNHPTQVNNYIHDNWIAMANGSSLPLAMMWGDDFGGSHITDPSHNNRGANNVFSYPGDENGQVRFQWGSTQFGGLSPFNATRGGGAGRYVMPWDNVVALNQLGIPSTPLGAAAVIDRANATAIKARTAVSP